MLIESMQMYIEKINPYATVCQVRRTLQGSNTCFFESSAITFGFLHSVLTIITEMEGTIF